MNSTTKEQHTTNTIRHSLRRLKRYYCVLLSLLILSASQVSYSAKHLLPKNLQWETANAASTPKFSSINAKKGGIFRMFTMQFPLTLRTVGPNANSSLRQLLLDNKLGLTAIHPNTLEITPAIASHWAYGNDGKTVYYKINPKARWSDGKPVTADDFVYTLTFMRSEYIAAPWYNTHYSQQITDVVKYDTHTIAVIGAKARPKHELHYYYGLSPTPQHFHKLNKHWVKNFNWRVEPNTGPYQISKFKMGRFVEFSRKKHWWAKDLRLYKDRYNVNKVRVQVINDENIAYQHFEKARLDSFTLILPQYWHEKAQGFPYDNGYINKMIFYNKAPQSSHGIYLNLNTPLLKDLHTRIGIAHSINIEKMLSTVLHGDYERLNNFHSGYGQYTNQQIKARPFDLTLAAKHLRLAGWSEQDEAGIRTKNQGKTPLKFTLSYSTELHTERLLVLKDEAKKAGVEISLKLMKPSAFFKALMEKKIEAAWTAWPPSKSPSPSYRQYFHSDNANKINTNNITNTNHPDMDRMIDTYQSSTDVAQRVKLAHSIQELIFNIAAYIPTYSVPYTRGAYWRWMHFPETPSTRLSESLFNPFGSSGGLFWIEQNIKTEILKAREKRGVIPISLEYMH